MRPFFIALALSAFCLTARAAEQVVTLGSKVTLSVTHNGGVLTPGSTVPVQTGFAYQWFKDGRAIEGATGKTHVIPSAAPADVGNYTVRVSNAAGQVLSDTGVVSLLITPTKATTAVATETPAPAATPST